MRYPIRHVHKAPPRRLLPPSRRVACTCFVETERGAVFVSYDEYGDCYETGHVFVCEHCTRVVPWCYGVDSSVGRRSELCDACHQRVRLAARGNARRGRAALRLQLARATFAEVDFSAIAEAPVILSHDDGDVSFPLMFAIASLVDLPIKRYGQLARDVASLALRLAHVEVCQLAAPPDAVDAGLEHLSQRVASLRGTFVPAEVA